VNGVLAISRALGDHMLKENDVVTAIPYCSDTPLTNDDTYLLLACDGVWDVLSDQEAVDFIVAKAKQLADDATNKSSVNVRMTDIAKALVHEALERRSLDNVTAMLIRL